MSDRWPKWEAKTRAILVETAIPTAPMTVGVIHPILEAATLPIRGQEEKSAFGAMNGWCDAMPYVAGEWHRSLVGELETRSIGISGFNPYV